MTPKICTSIAAETARDMNVKAREAIAMGTNFVELRLDYLKPEELGIAITLSSDIKAKSLLTIRSKSQGGRFAGSEQDRLSWLRKMAEQQPMLVDVELETLRQNDELADYFDGQKTPILVSWHDFHQTPPDNELADLLSEMRVYSNYVKIVTTAKSAADSLRLLNLYDGMIGLRAIIFAMGEEGMLSRILCTVAGNAPFTYASFDSALAPGQLSLDDMRRLYDRIEEHSE